MNHSNMQAFPRQVRRARIINKTIGSKSAAGYLRNRGFSCEQALAVLFPARHAWPLNDRH